MAKGSVTDEQLATGLKSFGGFGALGQTAARPRREDPFRDTRAEEKPAEAPRAEEGRDARVQAAEALPRIEVVRTPPAEPDPPPAVSVETTAPLKLREKKPAVSRLPRAERKAEPAPEPELGVEKKAVLYTERVTVPLDPELRDAAEALAKDLQRRRTDKGERITANSVMRVALRVLLDAFDARSAGVINTEEELFEAVSTRLRAPKK